MGEFCEEELQKVDVHICLDPMHPKIISYRHWPNKEVLKNSLLTSEQGRITIFPLKQFPGALYKINKNLNKMMENAPKGKQKNDYEFDFEFRNLTDYLMKMGNLPDVISGETPSSCTYASARGLAKLGSLLTTKQLMSEEAWRELHSEPTCEVEATFGARTTYTKGGLHLYTLDKQTPFNPAYYIPGISEVVEEQLNKDRLGFYGWHGYGGSVF
jgi:hypothetical protein